MSKRTLLAGAAKITAVAALAFASNQISSRLVGPPSYQQASMLPALPRQAGAPQESIKFVGVSSPEAITARAARAPRIDPTVLASYGITSVGLERRGDLVAVIASASVYLRSSAVRGYWAVRLYDDDGEVLDERPIPGHDFLCPAGRRLNLAVNAVVSLPTIPGATTHLALVEAGTGKDLGSTYIPPEVLER